MSADELIQRDAETVADGGGNLDRNALLIVGKLEDRGRRYAAQFSRGPIRQLATAKEIRYVL